MAGNMNISGLEPIDDPEYRYKMPRVIGKVEGRGNGIKTVIFNVTDLAMSLKREPGEVCKFFGTELGAQSRYNEDDERAIVNGAHTNAMLQQLVHKYIELFVLCPNCRLPETKYKIKNGIIYHKCYACGSKDSVDMTHKLCTYIVNADKKSRKDKVKEKEVKGKASAKDGKEKKKDKKDKKKDKDKDLNDSGKDSAKDKKKKDKEKKKKVDKSGSSDGDLDGDLDGKDDDSNFGEEVATMDNLEVDDAVAFDNSVAAIRRHLADGAPDEMILEEVRTAQTFAAFPPHYRIHLYVAAAFAESDKVTAADIESKTCIFSILKNRVEDQRHIVGAFELLCQVQRPSLKGFFPVILKHLYDADIVEEEALLMWAGEGERSEYTPASLSDKQVKELKEKAEPFITWLEEADEEEEDDHDDDEDGED